MQRRTFPNVSAAAAATTRGRALLGTWQADAAPAGVLRAAPTTPFAVGVRQYNWTRGSRQSTTYVYYLATGNPSGAVTAGRSSFNGWTVRWGAWAVGRASNNSGTASHRRHGRLPQRLKASRPLLGPPRRVAGLRLLPHDRRLPDQGFQRYRQPSPPQRAGSHRRAAEQHPQRRVLGALDLRPQQHLRADQHPSPHGYRLATTRARADLVAAVRWSH
jgi:hypothetical protein